jgi:hypothetical protein
MPQTIAGMSRGTLVRGFAAAGGAVGLISIVAPRVIDAAFQIAPTPDGHQLLRLLGTRTLALSVWALTAQTDEETDRALAVFAAMNAADAITTIAARDTGTASRVRAVTTYAAFAAGALGARALKG